MAGWRQLHAKGEVGCCPLALSAIRGRTSFFLFAFRCLPSKVGNAFNVTVNFRLSLSIYCSPGVVVSLGSWISVGGWSDSGTTLFIFFCVSLLFPPFYCVVEFPRSFLVEDLLFTCLFCVKICHLRGKIHGCAFSAEG